MTRLSLSGPKGPLNLLGLMTVPLALQAVHSHVAVWAWIALMGMAVACAMQGNTPGTMREVGGSPASAHDPSLVAALRTWLLLALAGVIIDGIMGLWHGEALRTLRQDGKVMLAAAALLVLARHPQRWRPDSTHAHAGLSTAALPAALPAALATALVGQLIIAAMVGLLVPRAQLPMTAVPWCTSVALTMAVVAPLAFVAESRSWRWLLRLALLAGMVALLAGRSRAAWVVLPWVVVVWIMSPPGHTAEPVLRRRGMRAGLAALAAIAAVLIGLAYDARQPVQVERGIRLLDLLQELQALDAADPKTSTGSRLLLWQEAWATLGEHPTGIGQAARIERVQAVIPPETMPDLPALVHVHQQFLNQAMDHGWPGLLASLLSAAGIVALALRAPHGILRRQLTGVALVHITGLLFNANLTHGPYAFALAATVAAVVLMHLAGDSTRQPPPVHRQP